MTLIKLRTQSPGLITSEAAARIHATIVRISTSLPVWLTRWFICFKIIVKLQFPKWFVCVSYPAWGRGTPFLPLLLPCPFTSSSFALYYLSLLPFLIHFTYFLLLSIRSLSTRIVPLHFQAWGRRRRPNLGLVCFCVMIMLSVLLS